MSTTYTCCNSSSKTVPVQGEATRRTLSRGFLLTMALLAPDRVRVRVRARARVRVTVRGSG